MDIDQSNNRGLAEQYRNDVMQLAAYIPWFEKQAGQSVSSMYDHGNDMMHTIAFPIYDSNLLAFVKAAKKTQFIDRNYRYVYSRNKIQSSEDELRLIENATIAEFNILTGILSRYIILGNSRGTVWTDGVKNGVYLKLVLKMKEIVDFWGTK